MLIGLTTSIAAKNVYVTSIGILIMGLNFKKLLAKIVMIW